MINRGSLNKLKSVGSQGDQLPQQTMLPSEVGTDFAKILTLNPIAFNSLGSRENLPLFAQFIQEGRLPTGYALSPDKEQLIRDLFTEKSLDNEICLIDLLGIAICDRIKDLSGAHEKEKLDSICERFSSSLFATYLYLFRRTSGNPEMPDKHIVEKFYATPDSPKFLRELQKVKADIRDVIASAKARVNASSFSSAKKRELSAKYDAKQIELNAYLDLFLDVFQSSEAGEILMDKNLIFFSGSFHLMDEKPIKEVLKDLQQYAAHIRDLHVALERQGGAGPRLSPTFSNLCGLLRSLETMRFEDIIPFQQQMLYFVTTLKSYLDTYENWILEADQGLLSHSQWKEINGISSPLEKSPEEFVEMLRCNSCQCRVAISFLKDLERLTEHRIFAARFPDMFCPRDRIKDRIAYNGWVIAKGFLSLLGESSNESPIPPAIQNRIRSEAHAIFDLLLHQIQETPLFSMLNSRIDQFVTVNTQPSVPREEIHEVSTEEMFSYFNSDVLDSFTPHIESLQHIIRQLPERQRVFIQELQQEINQDPSARTYTLQDIKDLLFKELTPFFRILILLNDIENLRGNPTALISEDLASFLVLENLTIPQPIASIPATSQVQKKTVEALSSSSKQTKLQKEKKKAVKVSIADPVEENQSTISFTSKNVREVMDLLHRWGFLEIRQTGSHSVLKKNGSGPQVVVPVGSGRKELPTGTLKSIQRQAQQALAIGAPK